MCIMNGYLFIPIRMWLQSLRRIVDDSQRALAPERILQFVFRVHTNCQQMCARACGAWKKLQWFSAFYFINFNVIAVKWNEINDYSLSNDTANVYVYIVGWR